MYFWIETMLRCDTIHNIVYVVSMENPITAVSDHLPKPKHSQTMLLTQLFKVIKSITNQI